MAFLLVKRYRVPREVMRAQGRSIAAFVFYNVVFGLSHEGIDNAAHFGGFAGGLLIGIAAALLLLAMADAALSMMERQSPEERYAAGTVWFDYGEPRVLVVYNDLVEQAKAGDLTDDEMASRINSEIIPFYEEAKKRLRHEKVARGAKGDARKRVGTYVGLRHDAMVMFEQGLRSSDPKVVASAMEVLRRSDEAARQINEAARATEAAKSP